MLLKFFLTCNKIGAFTLGGGYAMIPIMEREYVDKNHWLSREEFMDIMVVAQTTPGIFSVDMASHIGYKLRGVWGGIVGALGIALPSIITILLIAIFFSQLQGQRLRGEILPWCTSGRGGADCRSLFQDGTHGPYHVVDVLDTRRGLSAHRGILGVTDLDHHRGRRGRIPIWESRK